MAIIDLARYRPASVLVIDLVKHTQRPKHEIRRIQNIVESEFSKAIEILRVNDTFYNYTGDGYVCAFVGDTSARMIDFINLSFPDLTKRLNPFGQNFRAGFDFGLLHLRDNALTKMPEHFDKPGIQAARLEPHAPENTILCTNSVFEVFSSHYLELFNPQPINVQTKDREIIAYELLPVDYSSIKQALMEFFVPIEESTPSEEDIGKRNKLLVVDDDPKISEGLVASLSECFPAYTVISTSNIDDAFSVFKEGEFAAVVTDLRMIEYNDGLILTEKLTSIDDSIPVVMLTAYSSEDFATHFFDCGGAAFIDKGLTVEPLLRTIRMAINGTLINLFKKIDFMHSSIWPKFQELSAIVAKIFSYNSDPSDIAQSILTTKTKHLVSIFVSSIHPGTDIKLRIEELTRQLNTINILARYANSSYYRSFFEFLNIFVEDSIKTHKDITFSLSCDDLVKEEPFFKSGKTLLSLVLVELSLNSIHALSGSGNIDIEVTALHSAEQLQILFFDNGPGVSLDIEDIFFNDGISSRGSGYGLGLHLVKESVRRLGGEINYANNNGAQFKILIPLQ